MFDQTQPGMPNPAQPPMMGPVEPPKLIEQKKKFGIDKNTIIIGVAVVGILLTGALVYLNSSGQLSFFNLGSSPETIAKNSIEYLNTNVLDAGRQATIDSFSEESGVIRIELTIEGKSYTSYATKDGKLFFPEAITLGESTGEPTNNSGKEDLEQMRPVGEEDHIRGNINAPIKIVEYSDTECPFCKRFHDTLKQVMQEYGQNSRVAWVYRHLPLEQLHPKAPKEAEALECANELGGNNAFWAYTDRIYVITPSNNGLDSAELPKIAQFVGLNVTQFNNCLQSGKYAEKVAADAANAIATAGNNVGTPWSIVVAANGKKFALSGAQPYESVKQLIETALQEQ